MPTSTPRRLAARIGLLLVSTLVALGAGELGLRLSGFSLRLAPEKVEFGWPDPVVMDRFYLSDPDLFWVPSAYPDLLERLRANPGFDVAFLGDSCLEFGEYHWQLMGHLDAAVPGRALRAESFGVGGWSTHQGLRQLRRDVLPVRPRVVVINYGWNDHWVGFGVQDADLAAPAETGLGSLRLVHLMKRAGLGLKTGARDARPLRVAPDDFRGNLVAMVRAARDAGVVPILVTAPDAHVAGQEPVKLAERHLPRLEDLIPLHQRYVGIVREVAAAEDAVLCDAAAWFAELSEEDRVLRYFIDDGIHLRADGDAKLGELLFGCLESHGVVAALRAVE